MSAQAGETAGEGAPAPDLAGIVQQAQERLAHAVRVGQLRNDPLASVLEALSVSLSAQQRLHEANVADIREARQPVDPAAIARIEKAAVTGADRRAAELAQVHAGRTLLIAGGIYVASLLGMAVVADQWGHAAERVAFRQTEDQLRAAFAAGPASAQGWALLAQNNDAAAALSHCWGSDVWRDPNTSRKVCRLLVYIEGPKQDARQ